MLTWLKNLVASFRARRAAHEVAQKLQDDKRRKPRASARRRREREAAKTLAQARALVNGTFVIADLETPGFSARDQIMEIAGILVNAHGEVLEEFRALVCIRGSVPQRVRELTGITDALLTRRGLELCDAFEEFVDFCGDHPVFCHNAGFDRRFLQAAAARLKVPFNNEVHCSLKVARAAGHT